MDNIDTPVTKGYNDKENRDMIKKELQKTGVVQLQKFMTTYHYGMIYNILSKSQTHDLIVLDKYNLRTIFPTDEIEQLLNPIKNYVENMLDKKLKSIKIIKAEHGEYTIIHDDQKEEQGYDAILDFTNNWNPDWGGIVYYRFMDKDVQLAVPSMQNSLVIVSKEGSKSYIKYINHLSKGKERLFVVFSF